jgi:hypothetical protein
MGENVVFGAATWEKKWRSVTCTIGDRIHRSSRSYTTRQIFRDIVSLDWCTLWKAFCISGSEHDQRRLLHADFPLRNRIILMNKSYLWLITNLSSGPGISPGFQ